MIRLGLLGWPVGHSVSPAMHNAALRAMGVAGHYDLLPIRPVDLAERVTALIAEGYTGFNVTVPHKRAVLGLPQVNSADEDVRAIGAANTLIRRSDGTLHAANTDWRGFAGDLRAHRITVAGEHCLILGTGGSSAAVAYALNRIGAARLTFVSRVPAGRRSVIGYDDLAQQSGVGLIVNTTPVGMHPHTAESPWPAGVHLPVGAAVYDLIYNPASTRLLQDAAAAGLIAVGGLGMLVRQGALSFARWVHADPPLDVMTTAAREALTRRKGEAP